MQETGPPNIAPIQKAGTGRLARNANIGITESSAVPNVSRLLPVLTVRGAWRVSVWCLEKERHGETVLCVYACVCLG